MSQIYPSSLAFRLGGKEQAIGAYGFIRDYRARRSQQRRKPKCEGYHGFTLVETLIVVILLGVLIAGAYILWPGTSINLDAQTALLANDIRYTQTLAMTRGQRFRWVRVSDTSYQILDSAGNAVAASSGEILVTLGGGIAFGTFTNLPNNLVAFDTRGIPYTDAAFPGTMLGALASISLTLGGNTETITIAPETGRVAP